MKWIVLGVVATSFALFLGFSFIDRFEVELVKGKRVLITGASTGIGEQMAYQYAQMGAKIFITARREHKLQQVITHCKEVGDSDGEYHYLPADMADVNSYESVIKVAESVLGGLDYLILNHIGPAPYKLWRGKPENFTLLQQTMDVNFNAYVHLASHALPLLEKSRGSITVVSSIAGKLGMPYHTSYSASKFALDGFFSGLRQELKITGSPVSVTLCVIGFISTENAVEKTQKFGADFIEKLSPGTPEDAAVAIIKGSALRYRQVYFPYIQAKFSSLSRDWITDILEGQIRLMYSDP